MDRAWAMGEDGWRIGVVQDDGGVARAWAMGEGVKAYTDWSRTGGGGSCGSGG